MIGDIKDLIAISRKAFTRMINAVNDDNQTPAQHTPIHLKFDLRSLDEFLALKANCPPLFDVSTETRIREHALSRGVYSDFFGPISPSEIAVIGPELREHLHCKCLNSRQRAILDEVVAFQRENALTDQQIKIYGHEAITSFALIMRGRFPKYIGTEYCVTEEERTNLFPIGHGDICASHFKDNAFHLIVSGDVLEHVPDIDAALRDSARLLMPGGRLLATFPFNPDMATSTRMADLVDGQLVFHHPPIYHGNPMRDEGSLVFEFPAWDIIMRARKAGFADGYMRLVCDEARGIGASCVGYSSEVKGVFVAIFVR